MVKKALSKEAKVKRVDTNLKLKRAPTKSELKIQVKNLQKTNDALEESNRKKIELLESFEWKIINLEKQIDYLSYSVRKLRQKQVSIQSVKNAILKEKMKEN